MGLRPCSHRYNPYLCLPSIATRYGELEEPLRLISDLNLVDLSFDLEISSAVTLEPSIPVPHEWIGLLLDTQCRFTVS